MKVEELIKALKQVNPSTRVLLASDEEGNSFGDVGEGFGFHLVNEVEPVIAIYPENSIAGDEIADPSPN